MRVSDSIWTDVLDYVALHYDKLARAWFRQLIPVSLEGGVLTIQALNAPQLRYLNEHCRRAFAEAAQAATDRLVTVRFRCDASEPAPDPLPFSRGSAGLPLGRDHTFENFITGPCNRLAHAASVAVAERPGTAYNPLFVHGDVGLGKTHLLQAICHELRRRDSQRNLMYLSCEAFTNHFLEAVQAGALHEFRYCYRHVDTLVIDDIQFLGEHERSQEEFFHTFNTLQQSERQIVLSADSMPHDIPSLEERLVSRFSSGLVALVDKPCLETRMAIVRTKAELRGIDLPHDVTRFVASRIDSNVRELEGALSKIDLLSQTNGRPIDVTLAREALGGPPAPPPRIDISDILNVVSQHYNVRLPDLRGKKRTQSVAHPRQICMYLARELSGMSLEEIGSHLGGRDHTTVLHAHRLIGAKRAKQPALDATLHELSALLKTEMQT